MKKLYFILVVIFSLSLRAADADVKILVVGDSWAKLMCLNSSIENSLKRFSIKAEVACFKTTIMGSKAHEWNQSDKQEIIRNAFKTMPNIEVVILSIGGNDYFSAWQKFMQGELNQNYKIEIQNEIKKNIEFIKSLKKNLKFVISGYDYGNFTVLKEDNFLTHTYVSIYNRVGRPSPEKLNEAFINMNEQYALLSREMQDVYFSNHMGLIHFYLGIPEKGISKFSTAYPGQYPDYQPIAGGDKRYGNTIGALLTLPFNYKNFIDPYHLNSTGFQIISDHLISYYIRHMLTR